MSDETPIERVEAEQYDFEGLEAPNLSNDLTPDQDGKVGGKAIVEMSDEELQAWYNSVRDVVTNPQTLRAHMAAGERAEGAKSKRTKKEPQRDISEYI